jgi:RHS repeat-associated protein
MYKSFEIKKNSEIRYYSLDAQTRIPALVSTEAVEGQLLVNSADWDADNLTLVYATMDVVNGYQLHRNTGFTYSEALNKPVTLARGANNELFVNHSGAADLYLLVDNQLLPTTTGLAGYAFTGTIPQQSHFVQDKNPVEENLYTRDLGNKRYELTDHLGNVRATVSDRLKVSPAAAGGDLEGAVYYEADLQSTATYYPFGMTIGSLSKGSEGYRFGFNGKEKDQNGEFGLTHCDYGFRIYNPAIARFLSVDPLFKSYPELTPYQFASNTPIAASDLDGLEARLEIMMRQEDLGLVKGTIAAAEVRANQNARAVGALIGAGLVTDFSLNNGRVTKGTLKDLSEQLVVKTFSSGNLSSAVYDLDFGNALVKGVFSGLGIKGKAAKFLEEGLKTMIDVNLKEKDGFDIELKDNPTEIAVEFGSRMLISKYSDKIKGESAAENINTSLSINTSVKT